ncbi:hypothetical protein DIPPA_13962 [Diplonema papillatum]|nr:hypothetical protein DIPPA_13962 [Diplonema papillatum]
MTRMLILAVAFGTVALAAQQPLQESCSVTVSDTNTRAIFTVTTLADSTATTLQGETWDGIPSYFVHGRTYFITSFPVNAEVTMACETPNAFCLFHVVVYRCLPCSATDDGGVPEELLAAGFEPSTCGPTLSINQDRWETTVYRKLVSGYHPVTVTLRKPLVHAAVLTKTYADPCDTLVKKDTCTEERCSWNDADNTCKPIALCPERPQGPNAPNVPSPSCICPMSTP